MGNSTAAVALGPAWEGYEELAEVCREAGIAGMQLQVLLLHCRGLEPAEVRQALGISAKARWRYWHRASRRLLAAYPILAVLLEHARSGQHRLNRDILEAFPNCGARRDHGPALARDECGQLRTVTLRARMVAFEDLGWVHITAADLLTWLLAERRAGRLVARTDLSPSES